MSQLSKKLIKDFLEKKDIFISRRTAPQISIRFMKKLEYFRRRYNQIEGLKGDVLECGIGEGVSFIILAYLLSEDEIYRKLWGYDSFEGFPEPDRADKSSRDPQKGEWKVVDRQTFKKRVASSGFKPEFLKERVRIVEGFFEHTVRAEDFPDGIAFLNIDADLYQSYKVALERLFPVVNRGGVVLLDEYKEARWPGATKAVDEYFNGTSQKIDFDQKAGKYFLVKR